MFKFLHCQKLCELFFYAAITMPPVDMFKFTMGFSYTSIVEKIYVVTRPPVDIV
jgi:hypothetical protein